MIIATIFLTIATATSFIWLGLLVKTFLKMERTEKVIIFFIAVFLAAFVVLSYPKVRELSVEIIIAGFILATAILNKGIVLIIKYLILMLTLFLVVPVQAQTSNSPLKLVGNELVDARADSACVVQHYISKGIIKPFRGNSVNYKGKTVFTTTRRMVDGVVVEYYCIIARSRKGLYKVQIL